jgi:hypothetical protein
MAVDTTLISGAYRANKPTGVPGAKFATDIADKITDPAKAYITKIGVEKKVAEAEWDKYAEDVLNNSDLVSEQYESLYDDVMAGKSDYARADKKTQDLMKRNLVAMAGDYDEYKTLREDVAINLNDYSPAFKGSPEGKAYLEILKGDGKKLIQQDGRLGIEVNGEFKSISSIKQELDQNKIDDTSIEALESYRIVAEDSTKPFNRDQTRTKIKNNLVYKGSYNSLKNDEIIPGRTFRGDLAKSLMKKTYSDLGIKDDDFEGIDGVNSDNVIDAQEAENIIQHLEQDEGQMKEIMADYYTNYIQQNASGIIDPAKSPTQQMIGQEDTLLDPEVGGIGPGSGKPQYDAEGNLLDDEGNIASEFDNADFDESGEYIPQEASQTSSEQESATYNYTGVSSLSVDASGGSANILEDGNKITMKNVRTGNMLIPTVDVEGVKAEGSNIVIATSMGVNQNFGKFVKRGGRYKWVADEKNMKLFNENATAKQKKAFNEFIQIVQTDPAYADQLLKHIKSGSGNINAGTLK